MTRILPLPINGIFWKKFNALESTYSLYEKEYIFVHYQNIETFVRAICKKILMQDLQQILTIIPDLPIQWTANLNELTNKKELKLILTAMDYDPYMINK